MSLYQGGDTVLTTDEFGARLALIRWRMGWNQKEAALACGLPQSSWREWELSGRVPHNLVEVAARISRATGLSDYWIMTGKVAEGRLPNDGDVAGVSFDAYDGGKQATHKYRHLRLVPRIIRQNTLAPISEASYVGVPPQKTA